MEDFSHRQQNFVQNFLKHSTSMMQNGFAYLFSHPDLIPMMDDEMKKIRALEGLQRRFPETRPQYEQKLRQSYIEYIVKITNLGLKYVKCHPKAYNEIARLHSIFDEYDKLRNEYNQTENASSNFRENRNAIIQRANDVRTIRRNNPSKPCNDKIWNETFKQINALNNKIENLQSKFKIAKFYKQCTKTSETVKKPCKKTSDTLKEFNNYLANKLKDINIKKEERKRERQLAKAQPKAKCSAKKFPECCLGNQPEILQKIVNLQDSDDIGSEVMINVNEFSKPSVGPIERHLVIPVKSSNNLKISPRFVYTKSSDDGKMKLDLNLNFDHEVMYKDKLVKNICISNDLPGHKNSK